MAAGRARGWRDPKKERYWRRMVWRWERSRLSVREFCDWQSLSESLFYAWRRELAKRDRENQSTRRDGPATIGSNDTATPPQFVPVRVVADGQAVSRLNSCLEVQLPTGVQLRVPTGFDRQTLADVLWALEARPC